MREILIIHHFGGLGGAGVSLLDIVDSLVDDFKITVVCPNYPNEMVSELKKRSVSLIELTKIGFLNFHNGGSNSILSLSSLNQYRKILNSYNKIVSIIKNFSGDIVMVNSMTLSWIGPIIKKFNKKGICFNRETYNENNKIGTKIIRYFMKKYFDISTFISKYDNDQTVEISEEKKKIIYDRVHKERFKPSKQSISNNPEYKVLFLGGFSKLKGAHIIIDAMNYLKDRNYKLIFIGNTEIKNNLSVNPILRYINKKQNHYKINVLKTVYENSLEDKIEFRSKTITPEELYTECDVIVFPSTIPHQARPIYEAGFSKIPIIISDFENTDEFVTDGITGFTFDSNSSINLAETIINVLTMDYENISNIIDNNYVQTLKNHDYNSLREDLIEIINIL